MLKNNRGVTLLSLIIYILVLTIVLSVLTTIVTNFDRNKEFLKDQGKYIGELDKFALYFIRDVKSNSYANITANQVVFSNGAVYRYEKNEKSIYKDKVKIAHNIEYCNFVKKEIKSGNITKIIINVDIIPTGYDINRRTTDYVLKYW